MYRLFSSMSFTSYTIVVALVIVFSIYSIFDLNKKKPGHPYKYLFYCMIPMMIVAFFYRYVHEFEVSFFWINLIDVISLILVISMFVVLGYSSYLAYKRGYISEQGKRLLKSTLIPCVVVFVLCALGIILIDKFWV